MNCKKCNIELIDITTLTDKFPTYLCPKCDKEYIIKETKEEKPVKPFYWWQIFRIKKHG